MINSAIDKLLLKQNLTFEEASECADLLMKGEVNTSQTAALLTLLKVKGETSLEIGGFAKAMRNNSVKISFKDPNTIDVCGTGGDNSGSFNISTAVSFVAAGAGVSVAKHGNRSITSKSGSSDVLSELGIKIDLTPEQSEKALSQLGIAFLFAPIYHPAMKNVAPVRMEIGFKTIFNILGPLTNPATVKKQMIGTYNDKIAETMAEAAQLLGIENVTFVCTNNQFDEITLSHPTKMILLENSTINSKVIEPHEFGYDSINLKEIRGSDPSVNAKIILDLFNNPKKNSHFNVVSANTAVALQTSGKFDSFEESKQAAEDSILSGKAQKKLNDFIQFSNDL